MDKPVDKKRVHIRIEDFSQSTDVWKVKRYSDGVKIGISFYCCKISTFNGCNHFWHLIDSDITQIFPELSKLQLIDERDGFMVYYGDKSVESIKKEIMELGFNINDIN